MKNALTLSGLFAALSALPASAQEGLQAIGKPVNGLMGFQPPVTELAHQMQWLDDFILIIITVICVFVTGLILYAVARFNRKAHPKPAAFTHHTPIEIAWTVIPIIILLGIGAYSLPVLFNQQEIPKADITIKVTGYQWYWGYEYVDDNVAFDSFMLAREELEEFGYDESLYRLATDTAVVVPIGATVVMQVTGADVIHSWTIPAFGVKQDAVPGRLNERLLTITEPGIYYGQCSELCGVKHGYMPIAVEALPREQFDAWVLSKGGTLVDEEDAAEATDDVAADDSEETDAGDDAEAGAEDAAAEAAAE